MHPNPKDYFKFSKIERTGILTLIILIALSIAVNIWWKERVFQPDFERTAKVYFQQIDSIRALSNKETETDVIKDDNLQLIDFDPNTLGKEGWMAFGLSERQTNTIINYLSKGGKFRIKSDVKKMYSISEEKFKQLEPYILLPESLMNEKNIKRKEEYSTPKIKPRPLHQVLINTADSLEWIKLRGIGPVLSSRIIKYRNRLGGFHRIDQLAEVWGVKDSLLNELKAQLVLDSMALRKINVNGSNAKSLKQLPYLNWAQANAIVKYRKQHGYYKNLEELYKIVLMDSLTYKKIQPYLKLH